MNDPKNTGPVPLPPGAPPWPDGVAPSWYIEGLQHPCPTCGAPVAAACKLSHGVMHEERVKRARITLGAPAHPPRLTVCPWPDNAWRHAMNDQKIHTTQMDRAAVIEEVRVRLLTFHDLNRRLLAECLNALVIVPAVWDPDQSRGHFPDATPFRVTAWHWCARYPNGSVIQIRTSGVHRSQIQGIGLDIAVLLTRLSADVVNEVRARLVRSKLGLLVAPLEEAEQAATTDPTNGHGCHPRASGLPPARA